MKAWICAIVSLLGVVGLQSHAAQAEISLIANGNDAPFTSPDWPGDGMIVELARAAFAASPDPLPVSLTWGNGTEQLTTLGQNQKIDIALLWPKPECALQAG